MFNVNLIGLRPDKRIRFSDIGVFDLELFKSAPHELFAKHGVECFMFFEWCPPSAARTFTFRCGSPKGMQILDWHLQGWHRCVTWWNRGDVTLILAQWPCPWNSLPLCISWTECIFWIDICMDDVLGDKGVSRGGIVVLWPLTLAQWHLTLKFPSALYLLNNADFGLVFAAIMYQETRCVAWQNPGAETFDPGPVTFDPKFPSALS
jgi:hypothetical protein